MKKRINTSNAPKAVGPYSQAIEAGGTLYVSGQLPVDPATGNVPDAVEEQAAQALTNLKAILAEAGYTMDDVAKTTVLLDNMDNFAAVNTVYASFFAEPFPARACYQVAKLPLGVKVEIEAIAAK